VTFYHWLVVIIASAGWLFDCMDQRLFILGRESALRELMPGDPAAVRTHIGYATTSMILGWATGGIIFGMMSDKIGRVKTMVATLLVYSGFTGLSGLANTWVDFTIYRFLAGIGIGGMFGAATTLVAESVPAGFRAMALGSLQALSALGNIIGSLLSLQIPPGSHNFFNDYAGWRVLFFVGIVPALLVVPIIFVLKEPDSWLKAKADARAGIGHKNVGSPVELFRDSRWRRNTIVGLFLGVSGMIGLWGIGFFSPELISTALRGAPQNVVDTVRGWATAFQDVGSFLGMITFTMVAAFLSRRLAFLLALLLSMFVTMFVFWSLKSATDAYWMLPMMGFAQLAVFAGYSIYFPELFPTRLRGTGVGFCYNTVRYLAAPAPTLMGYLATLMSFRSAAVLMSTIYLVGVVALIWAPETKGKPLPEG
jgi:predicted MFS family arabinose efflux permease